jgi:hypothetical protein
MVFQWRGFPLPMLRLGGSRHFRDLLAVVLAALATSVLAELRAGPLVPAHPLAIWLLPVFLIAGCGLFSLRYRQIYLTNSRALGAGAVFSVLVAALAGGAFGCSLLMQQRAVMPADPADVDWRFTLTCAGVACSTGITVGFAVMAALQPSDSNLIGVRESRRRLLSLIDELDAPGGDSGDVQRSLGREAEALTSFADKAMARLPRAEQPILVRWIDAAGAIADLLEPQPLDALRAKQLREEVRLRAMPLRSART